MLRRVFVVGLVFASLAWSALPPGYEDELFCPRNFCLRPAIVKKGFTGPRTMFHECFDPASGAVSRPRAWGTKMSADIKDELLNLGYHSTPCSEMKGDEDESEEIDFTHSLESLEPDEVGSDEKDKAKQAAVNHNAGKSKHSTLNRNPHFGFPFKQCPVRFVHSKLRHA